MAFACAVCAAVSFIANAVNYARKRWKTSLAKKERKMPRVWIAFVAALLGMGGILWGEWFFLEAKKRMAGVMVGAAGVALVAVALAIK